MARQQTAALADAQPDELGELKATVQDFMKRLGTIEQEIEVLKDDRKALIDEFRDRLDIKTLQAAMRIVKIKQGVVHKDTFDAFLEVLEATD